MTTVTLAARCATVLFEADVVVLGATWRGMTAALAAAAAGRRVGLLEPGTTLGVEFSQEWDLAAPAGDLADRLGQECRTVASEAKGLDLVLGTIALDRVVATAGVRTIVNVLPVRPFRAPDGRLAGVEVVGKSGRQVVRAPVVVDATPGCWFACRAAGLEPAAAPHVGRRCYVHGLALTGPSSWPVPLALKLLGDVVTGRPAAWPEEAILELRMAAGGDTYAAVVAAFAHLRAQVPAFARATLVEVAPREIADGAPEPTSLAALADTGLIALANGVPAAWTPGTRPLPTAPAAGAETPTWELAAAPEQDLASVELGPTPATSLAAAEVVVAGAGVAGAFAALAAATMGRSVVVLDPLPVPGGVGTVGRIHSYYYGLTAGMQARLDAATTALGGTLGPGVTGFHPIAKAAVLRTELAAAGGRLLGGQFVFGALREGRRVTAVLTASPSGYAVVPCTVAIDATGDGDLAAAAGAEWSLGRAGDGFPQPYSCTPAMVRDGALHHHNFDAGWVDPTDTLDYSRALIHGRGQVGRQGPFTPAHHYCTLAAMLGVRESRFIQGPVTMRFSDFLAGRTYPDTVAVAHAHYDNHAMDYAEESEFGRDYVVFGGGWRPLVRGEVPYRALYPAAVDGLLVAGRALSVDHDLHQLLRMQRDLQTLGEVCGVAAALACEHRTTPGELDPDVLRVALRARDLLAPPAPPPLAPVLILPPSRSAAPASPGPAAVPPPPPPEAVAGLPYGVATATDVACPSCQERFDIEPEFYNQIAECPECGCEFVIKPPRALPYVQSAAKPTPTAPPTAPTKLDLAALRAKVHGRSLLLPPEPPPKPLEGPAAKWLAALGTNDAGLAVYALSQIAATVIWARFFATETDARRRFAAAVAAALGGMSPPVIATVLRETVAARVRTPTLGVKSPPPYVVAALALARLRAPGATEMLGELLADADLGPADLVLVLQALGAAGDPRGVAPIRAFLQRTAGNDFAMPMWGCRAEVPSPFRFAVELRAVRSLVQLGCREECHRLAAYTNDPSLLVRRHARRIVREAG